MMHRLIKITAILGIAAGATYGIGLQSQYVAPVGALRPGESIAVDFVSTGCFSSTHYNFEIGAGKKPLVSAQTFKLGKPEPVELGKLTLSPADVAGLNRLFQMYRTLPQGGCTTVDTITLTQMRGDKEIAKERFVDRTCSYERKDVLRFTELIQRLRRPVE